MKTVLIFYLNSLGLVLVLTQPRQPYPGSYTTDCKLTKAGHEYAGPLSVTVSGQTCQRWDSDQPHPSYFKKSTLFPEGNAAAAGNKCRNPDNDHNEGVWCYTTDLNKRWEECDVDFCNFTSPVFPIRPQSSTTSSQTSHTQTRSMPPSSTNPTTIPASTTILETIPWTEPSPTNPNTIPASTTMLKTIPASATILKTIPGSTTILKTIPWTEPSPTNPKTIPASTTILKTIPASTTILKTIPATTTILKTIPASTTILKTILSSTTILKTISPRTEPSTNRRSPSTKMVTTAVRLSFQLAQETFSSRQNASTNIVKTVLPIVGVIAVICVIVVIIVCRRRPTGLFQSPWRSPSSAERNQQATLEAKAKQNYTFDNPDYDNCQQLIEIDDAIKDHSSTDYITITDSTAVYATVDKFRLS